MFASRSNSYYPNSIQKFSDPSPVFVLVLNQRNIARQSGIDWVTGWGSRPHKREHRLQDAEVNCV
jgi:hypothetical protein